MNNNFERTFENLTRRIKGRTFITCESREIYDRLLADAKEAGFEIPKAFYEDKDIVSINMDVVYDVVDSYQSLLNIVTK